MMMRNSIEQKKGRLVCELLFQNRKNETKNQKKEKRKENRKKLSKEDRKQIQNKLQ
jgi:hypothetical protein